MFQNVVVVKVFVGMFTDVLLRASASLSGTEQSCKNVCFRRFHDHFVFIFILLMLLLNCYSFFHEDADMAFYILKCILLLLLYLYLVI